MIPAGTLDALQRLSGRAMTHQATITRDVETDDGEGGTSSAPQQVAAGVDCRVIPISEVVRDGVELGVEYDLQDWAIDFASAVDVQRGDAVTIGAEAYTVRGVLEGRSYEVFKRTVCHRG